MSIATVALLISAPPAVAAVAQSLRVSRVTGALFAQDTVVRTLFEGPTTLMALLNPNVLFEFELFLELGPFLKFPLPVFLLELLFKTYLFGTADTVPTTTTRASVIIRLGLGPIVETHTLVAVVTASRTKTFIFVLEVFFFAGIRIVGVVEPLGLVMLIAVGFHRAKILVQPGHFLIRHLATRDPCGVEVAFFWRRSVCDSLECAIVADRLLLVSEIVLSLEIFSAFSTRNSVSHRILQDLLGGIAREMMEFLNRLLQGTHALGLNRL